MNLLNVKTWLDRHFDPACRPTEPQVHRWMRDGKLPGMKVGGTWFIDEHAWLAGDDDLVQRVLKAS